MPLLNSLTFLLTILLLAAGTLHADDKTIAGELTKAGAKVDLDKEGNATSVFFKDSSKITPEQYKAIGQLKMLRSITLYNQCTITDEALGFLTKLERLEKFAVDGARISDDGMKQMAAWKSLKSLTYFHNLWDKTKFTGAGLAHLAAPPQFESFSCGGSTFTDAGMAAVGSLAGLKELHLWHDYNTDAGAANLTKLKALRSLRLAGQFTTRLTDASLEPVAQIHSLETLSLGETRLTYAGGLSKLKGLSALKALELDKVQISDDDLAKLKADLPNVKIKYTAPTEQEAQWLNREFSKKK